MACAEEVSLQIPQEPLAGTAGGGIQEFSLPAPHPRTDERHAVPFHLCKILFPNPGIARTRKIPVLFLRGEVIRAEGEKGLPVAGKDISLHAKNRT